MNPSSSKESGGGGGGPVKTTTSISKVDMLELKLGFDSTVSLKGIKQGCTSPSSTTSSSLPSSQCTKESQENIALGLNLGFQTVNPRHHDKELGFGSHDDASTMSSPSQKPLPTLFLPAVLHNNVYAVNHHYCSRRPHLTAGLWFSLRSIINREGEVLPQVPKAYIRVKRNDNVTVLMVKTYLVRKLGLSNESQMEISCMGQKLLHSQELKKVRDEIWLPKFQSSNLELEKNSHNLVMPLDYEKCCL